MPLRSVITRTYDPKLIQIIIGVAPVSGIMEGTFATFEFEESYVKSRGADGGIDRVNLNIDDGRLTLTLKQTSPTNDILSTLHTADKLTNAGKFPLTIADGNGTTLLFAANAWVVKYANVEYGDGMSSREWMIDTGPLTIKNIGSNIL